MENKGHKCGGCGEVHADEKELFHDVMGNPICTFCVNEFDLYEFLSYTAEY